MSSLTSRWTSERWHRVERIIRRAAELHSSERGAFLNSEVQTDPWLRDAVSELLTHHEDALSDPERTLELIRSFALDVGDDTGAPTLARPIKDIACVDEDLLGHLIDGKYRVEERLGEGGMGVVYRVRHTGLDRSFALKIVRRSQRRDVFLERFRTEAHALGKLKHPNIVGVTDYGVDQDRNDMPFLVMENLEGTTLSRLRAEVELSVDRRLAILQQVAEAIDHAHAAGVLHGDLKPDNVFISERPGNCDEVKILDFGLAQLLADSLDNRTSSARRRVAGTPGFMAPELVDGCPPSKAMDIYAFGVLVYEVMVGRRPFEGRSLALVLTQRDADPPQPSRLSSAIAPELDKALLAPLARDPEARPANASAVVTKLRRAIDVAAERGWRAKEFPRRTAICAALTVLSLAFASFATELEFLEALELRLVDARFAVHPRTSADPRIVLLTIDDQTLARDPTALVDRADEFGRLLARVFDAGAESVAIDFLLPAGWSTSLPFAELALKHGGRLTLAAFATSAGETIGTECVRGLTAAALGEERTLELFGYVNVDVDSDGIVRHGRSFHQQSDGVLRPTFVSRAARNWTTTSLPERFWIDHTVEWEEFRQIGWHELEAALDEAPDQYAGALVLVGGDYAASGDDYHRIPGGGPTNTVSGIVIQALVANTMLRGWPIRDAPSWVSRIVPVLLVIMAVIPVLFIRRTRWSWLVLLTAISLYSVAAFAAFRLSDMVWPLLAPLVAVLLAALGAAVCRSQLPPFLSTEVSP